MTRLSPQADRSTGIYAATLLGAAFANLDVEHEAIARTLGAGPGRVLLTVTLPLLLFSAVGGVLPQSCWWWSRRACSGGATPPGSGWPVAELMGARLERAGVTRRFGEVTALAGIDLDLSSGSSTTLLESSGCGKSTLFSITAGLRPTASNVRLDGASVVVPAERRPVTLVFQEPPLLPHLSVAQNVGYGLRGRPTPRRARSSPRCSSGSGSRRWAGAGSMSPRVGRSSGSRSPARWCSRRGCCCPGEGGRSGETGGLLPAADDTGRDPVLHRGQRDPRTRVAGPLHRGRPQDRAGPCGLGDGPAGAVLFPGSHPVVETRLPGRGTGRGTLTVHAAVGAYVAAGAAGVRLPALRCTVLAVER